ncbi:MAG: hypothetical protein NVSMB18_12110 [Acetobacteraceae bacterium]
MQRKPPKAAGQQPKAAPSPFPPMTSPPPSTPPRPLARRIRSLLDERGTTARQISVKAGLSPDGIRNIMRGLAKSPQIHTLQAIADALEVPLDRLLHDGDAQPYYPDGEKEAEAKRLLDAGLIELPEFEWPMKERFAWRVPLDLVARRVGLGGLLVGVCILGLEDGERVFVRLLPKGYRQNPEDTRGTFVVNNGRGYSLFSGRFLPGMEVVAEAFGRWAWL